MLELARQWKAARDDGFESLCLNCRRGFSGSARCPICYPDLREAVIAWLNEVEEIKGAAAWHGPYATATDQLIKLARELRSDFPSSSPPERHQK